VNPEPVHTAWCVNTWKRQVELNQDVLLALQGTLRRIKALEALVSELKDEVREK
jgi:hypothetical protein